MNFEEYEKQESKLGTTTVETTMYGIAWTLFPIFLVCMFGTIIATEGGYTEGFIRFLSIAVPLWTIFIAAGTLGYSMIEDGYTKERRRVVWASVKHIQMKLVLGIFGIMAFFRPSINFWLGLIILFVIMEIIYIFFNHKKPDSSKGLYGHVALEKGKALFSAFMIVYGVMYTIDKIVTGCKHLMAYYEVSQILATLLTVLGVIASVILTVIILYKLGRGYLWLNSLKYKKHMVTVIAKEKVEEEKQRRKEEAQKKKDEAKKMKEEAKKMKEQAKLEAKKK